MVPPYMTRTLEIFNIPLQLLGMNSPILETVASHWEYETLVGLFRPLYTQIV